MTVSDSIKEDALFRFSQARAKLLIDPRFVFFAALAMRLQPVVVDELPHGAFAATDGRRIFMVPGPWNALSIEHRMSVVSHEVLHSVFSFFSRLQHRDLTLFNIAHDLSINKILIDAGLSVPEEWCIPGTGPFKDFPVDLAAEDYYEMLKSMAKKVPYPKWGHAMPGKDEKDTDGLTQEWEGAVLSAAEAARKRGSLPGGLERLIGSITDPQVPWQQVLSHLLTERARNDFSWVRPNRRYMALGLYLPGLESFDLGRIACTIDTSGSISNEELAKFLGEIQGIVGLNPCELGMFYHHTACYLSDVWTPMDGPLTLPERIETGGTSHRDVIEKALDFDPKIIIALTDMYSEFPDEPGIPIVWCATTDQEAPYGTKLRIR